MSQYKSDDGTKSMFICSECESPLEKRLIEQFLEDKEVFCSYCGKIFTNNEIKSQKINKQNFNLPKKKDVEQKYISYSTYSPQIAISQPSEKKDIIHPNIPQINIENIIKYGQNTKRNKEILKKVNRINKNIFKYPKRLDKKKYKNIVKINKENFKKSLKENQKNFIQSKADNINSNIEVQIQIELDYNRIISENSLLFKNSLKNIKKHYKSSVKHNLKHFKKNKKENHKKYLQIRKENRKIFNTILKIGDNTVENLKEFSPIYYEIRDYVNYEPGKSIISQELIKTKSSQAVFDPVTGKRLRPKMRFDPITGKPLSTKTKDLGISEYKQKIYSNTVNNNLQVPEIFSILDPDLKNILNQLPISEENKTILAKSYIYLTEQQQIEFVRNFKGFSKQNKQSRKILQTHIDNLPINKSQKDLLLDQLGYTNDNEQEKLEIQRKEQEKLEIQRKEQENLEIQRKEQEKKRTDLLKLQNEKQELERIKRVRDLKNQIKTNKENKNQENKKEVSKKNPTKA